MKKDGMTGPERYEKTGRKPYDTGTKGPDQGTGASNLPGNGRRVRMAGILLTLVFLFAVIFIPAYRDTKKDTEDKVYTVNASDTAQALPAPMTESTPSDNQGPEEPGTEPSGNGIRELVFGGASGTVPGERVLVTGITEEMKRKVHYVETDFLKKLGSFLRKEDVHPAQIVFTGQESALSNENAVALTASLKEDGERMLEVVFFPELEGECLFLLREKDRSTQAHVEETPPSEQAQQQAAAAQPAPLPQEAVQTQPAQPEDDRDYDATKLSIRDIPKTLLNYISSPYEFQYSLYGFLYHSGRRSVTRAVVKSYRIDPDERTATIRLKLNNGDMVTAVYDRDRNGYTYS